MKLEFSQLKDCLKEKNNLVIYNDVIEDSYNEVSTDSRSIEKDDIFIALSGQNFDGADFIKGVLEKSPSLIIASKKQFDEKNLKIFDYSSVGVFLVDDVLMSYGQLASLYLSQFKGKKIAITGSAGKTSVKDFLAFCLRSKYHVFCSEKNYNNQIGVPQNIFHIKEDYDYYIFELGTNMKGEIETLSKIIHPDISIITNILSAHIGMFDGRQGLMEEKLSIIKGMKKGFLYIEDEISDLESLFLDWNGEDIELKKVKNRISLESYLLQDDIKTKCYLDDEFIGDVQISSYHHAKNLSFVATLLESFSFSRKEIIDVFLKLNIEGVRFSIERLDKTLIIDDAYNANMESMLGSIDWVMSLGTDKRKIFILGDVLELGEDEKKMHIQLGAMLRRKYLSSNNVQFNFVGRRMRDAFKSSSLPDRQYFFRTEEVTDFLKEYMEKEAIYFLKASNSMNFRYIIKEMKNVLSYTV